MLLGSDPEAFIVNTKTGLAVSSKRFTVGTKEKPEELGDGYALLNDNILIEGNVPPASNRAQFIANMTILWGAMNDRALTRLAHLENHDCMQISDDLMLTDEAREFGCSSFFDAWNGLLEIDTPQLNGNFRPAGCHIHIGIEDLTDYERMAIVRAFDMFVTLPSIKITGQSYRTSNLYGLLGACRLKTYGVEARSLGGHFFSPKYFEMIYDLTTLAVDYAYKNTERINDLPNITSYIGPERQSIINAIQI
jgi:hypothetical protein